MFLFSLASLAWGIWNGAHNATLAQVAATSAALAIGFMLLERRTLWRTERREIVTPWDRQAVWKQRFSNVASRTAIFLISTVSACVTQGIGYAIGRLL